MAHLPRKEALKRDRKALTDLFVRLTDMSPLEYNALIHAMWALDAKLNEITEKEENNV